MQYETNSANEMEGCTYVALFGLLWPWSIFGHFMELFGPCCLDKEQNETLAASTCSFFTHLVFFSAKLGWITARCWNFMSSVEIRLIFFLWSLEKYNYYEHTYSVCTFRFRKYNQYVARIFISKGSRFRLGLWTIPQITLRLGSSSEI